MCERKGAKGGGNVCERFISFVFQCLILSQDGEDRKSTVNQHMVEEVFRLQKYSLTSKSAFKILS